MKKSLEIVKPIRSNAKFKNFLEKLNLEERPIDIPLCCLVSIYQLAIS
jgi:hypothetical protein